MGEAAATTFFLPTDCIFILVSLLVGFAAKGKVMLYMYKATEEGKRYTVSHGRTHTLTTTEQEDAGGNKQIIKSIAHTRGEAEGEREMHKKAASPERKVGAHMAGTNQCRNKAGTRRHEHTRTHRRRVSLEGERGDTLACLGFSLVRDVHEERKRPCMCEEEVDTERVRERMMRREGCAHRQG